MNTPLPIPTQTLSPQQLNQHVYLLTGAAGGLGRATALSLAKLGATVILSGRHEDKLNHLYDEIEKRGYPTPAIIPFDLEQTEEEKYIQLINSIYNEFKRLDGVIHAACQLGVIGPLASQDSSFWLKVQQVNVNACFLINKACSPLLSRSEHASITMVSDSSARQEKAYWGAYGVSKSALESFSSILADEQEDSSINCNIFIPGPSLLPIRKKTHPGEESAKLAPAELVGDAITQVILSPENGQVYQV